METIAVPSEAPLSRVDTWKVQFNDSVARIPLRTRLVAIFSVLLLVGLTVSGAATLRFLNSYLVSQVDVELRDNLPAVIEQATYTCATNLSGGAASSENTDRLAAGIPPEYYWQFANAEGTVLCESQTSLFAQTTDIPQIKGLATSRVVVENGRRNFVTEQVDSTTGGTEWRVLKIDDLTQEYAFTVAAPLIDSQKTVNQVRWLLVCLGGIAVILGSLLGFAAVRHSLRPLKDVEQTAAAIAAGDLSQRVPALPENTEVGHLAAALNEMLTQIESAFAVQKASEERMRRFVSDASHELRTPLAVMRGFGELYRMGAITEDSDVAQTMRRIEDESIRMGSLVEDLLALARLDERQPLRLEPVDLTIIAVDAVSDIRGLAPGRTVTVLDSSGADVVTSGTVALGDNGRVRQVVANLVGNAVRHTPEGTPIEILVGPAEPGGSGDHGDIEEVTLAVRDHGLGLDPDQVERVFERFYRVDASRQRGQGGGSGLGLAIVAATVSAMNGRVSVAETEGGGATFTIALPAAPHVALDSHEETTSPDDDCPDDVSENTMEATTSVTSPKHNDED